jgi:hypothetical protein
MDSVYELRQRNYLKERITRRNQDTAELQEVTPYLSFKFFCDGMKSSVAFRGHAGRVIWGKLLPVRDDVQETRTYNCDVCGVLNSMHHAVFECKKMGIALIRGALHEDLRSAQGNFKVREIKKRLLGHLESDKHWGLYLGHVDAEVWSDVGKISGLDILKQQEVLSVLRQIVDTGYRMIQLWQHKQKMRDITWVKTKSDGQRLITQYYCKRKASPQEVNPTTGPEVSAVHRCEDEGHVRTEDTEQTDKK